jgi:long-chain acyl-CoA synthetase
VTPLGDASSPLTAPSGDPIVSCHFTYKGLGYPLGVLHAYSSYGACLRGCAERYAASAGGTHLVGLPMHPVYSLIGAVLMPLTLGAKLLVVRNIGARDVSELLAEHDVRFACLVPLLLRGMIARGGGTRPNLRSDLEVITGGSHLSPELATAVAERLGVEPLQGYGLTETLPVTSSVRGDNRAGSLGKPVREDVKVTIVDSRGREVPRGRVGEIAVAGPSLMRGFANRPRETARFLRDGRFHTGDVGHMDRDGFLHFDGRALPFTKCAAQMVDLREIEMVLLRHPKVADARATVSDERVSVSVILNKHAVMTPADVIAHAAQHLSKHKLPRRVKLYERAIQKLAVNQ